MLQASPLQHSRLRQNDDQRNIRSRRPPLLSTTPPLHRHPPINFREITNMCLVCKLKRRLSCFFLTIHPPVPISSTNLSKLFSKIVPALPSTARATSNKPIFHLKNRSSHILTTPPAHSPEHPSKSHTHSPKTP